MSRIQHQSKQIDGFPSYPPPPPPPPPSPYGDSLQEQNPSLPSPSHQPLSSGSGAKISPAVMFTIVILAVVFFVSGVVHLLVRFLLSKHSIFVLRGSTEEASHSHSHSHSGGHLQVSAATGDLQGQLRQLFHLHDSGLDQAFIDALPVFLFKEIMGGNKEPCDCAVCLCEFSDKDKLRLLPLCGHAFHIACIDTWLLSNSSCPLCRGILFTPGFPMDNPVFELDKYLRDEEDGCSSSIGSETWFPCADQKVIETEQHAAGPGEGSVFPVRLGKFRNLSQGGLDLEEEGEGSSSNMDARRCYSMGSYQYVVRPHNLRVALWPQRFIRPNTKGMEDNNGDSSMIQDLEEEEKKIGILTRRDSYSMSKIWLWPEAAAGNFSRSSNPPADKKTISAPTNKPNWLLEGEEQGIMRRTTTTAHH
ncbi:hypothetical protein Dimus_021067 [Dionaea muscipula]